ncbi:MAG: carboxypeptidase regulatory-like domain-containing protein [Bryobacteraceae bacterium]
MLRISARLPLVFLAALAVGSAQEFRALIYGRVTDSSSAVIPNVKVTASNTATGAAATTVSAPDGNYVLPQLPAGRYDVTAEAEGFRRYSRQGITLAVGDKANVEIRMEVGALSESVTVTAELTGIESNQSVMGQLMNSKAVAELPINGRQIFMLLQLSAGVLFTQQQFGSSGFSGTRPWDVNGTVSIHGSRPGGAQAGSNAFLLDGAPLGVSGAWTYSPLVDAVEEFKVTMPASDASQGLTGGGVINMTTKSGTNQLHGVLSHFIRNNIFDAVATQTNRAAAQRPDLKKQQHQWNAWSAMLSGPVIRNRLFYSGHYEGYRQRVPFPVTVTVPTLEQRSGDFSRTFNASGQPILVFDPLSTRAEGSRFVRDAFPGNRIPVNRTSNVARNVLKLIPAPNIVTDAVTNFNNFASSPNVGRYRYDAYFFKIDYLWNSAHRSFGSHSHNTGSENRAANGLPRGNPAKGGPDSGRRNHYSAIADHVWTINNTTVMNARASWDRFNWWRTQDSVDAFDARTLGFLGPTGANGLIRFPNFTFTDYLSLGPVTRIFQPDNTYSLVADVSKTRGRHFMKFGTRIGQARFNRINPENFAGIFNFERGFTQRDPQRADATSGNAMASFLLGYPAGGGTDVSPESSYENKFAGLYVQDDIKLTARVSVNVGLRWDVQTAPTERFDRLVVGFDPDARYTLGASPARGGFVFGDRNRRQAWTTNWRDFQPRTGVAWQLSSKLVWRAGYGMSFLPVNGLGGAGSVLQNGFSRRTPVVATIGGGVNAFLPGCPTCSTLERPFPEGVLMPPGRSEGPKTQVGQAINYTNPDYVVARVHQVYAGFDYQLPWRATLEASYVGSRTNRFPVNRQTNAIPLAERLKGVADPTYLNAAVPNPFAGAPELAGTGLAAATIARSQSQRPFPQFAGITMQAESVGKTSYDALEARVNKRLSGGLATTISYTLAKTLEAVSYREDQYTWLERRFADFDRTHHLSLILLYDVPVGRGRRLGAHWGRALDLIAGNWQYNMSLEAMNGTPTAMPDATPLRDPRLPNRSFDKWFDTCTVLSSGARSNCSSPDAPVTWLQLKPNELRTYSSRFPNLRNHSRANVNMSLFKIFPLRERSTFELRAEAFNAFNSPIYAGPNTSITSPQFGVVVRDQQNFPRNMQFAARLRW